MRSLSLTAMTPVIEAHRGGREDAPENTLAACRKAMEMGAAWIELDVRASRDGALVVFHDDKVDRVTDGAGLVGDMTLAELRRLDAGIRFSAAFAGERIPTFEEAAALVAGSGVRLNVEIKKPAGRGVVAGVVKVLREAGKERDYVVSSFGLEEVMAVRAAAPEIELALIGKAPEVIPLAIEHGVPWAHCQHESLTQALVDEAHGAGLRVNVWTVDDVERLAHWRAVGVDKLCTNRPRAMMEAGRLAFGRGSGFGDARR